MSATMCRLPPSTHPDIAAEAEQTQVQAARRCDPAALSRIGERLLAHLDPDGSAPSDQPETMRDALGSDSMPLTSGRQQHLATAALRDVLGQRDKGCAFRAAGVEVIEANQPDRATRRRRDKTDTLDAEAAAQAVLSGRATGSAKAGDRPVEMLRMFKLAKASAVKARTQTINQLKAVLVAADSAVREELSGMSTMLIRRCAQFDATTPDGITSAAVYTCACWLAHPPADREIDDLVHRITDTISLQCPTLLTRRGIGPDNAAALLIAAGDNPTDYAARPPSPRCVASAP